MSCKFENIGLTDSRLICVEENLVANKMNTIYKHTQLMSQDYRSNSCPLEKLVTPWNFEEAAYRPSTTTTTSKFTCAQVSLRPS